MGRARFMVVFVPILLYFYSLMILYNVWGLTLWITPPHPSYIIGGTAFHAPNTIVNS